MQIKKFLEYADDSSRSILDIDDSEIMSWNKSYGIPDNFILESVQNLRKSIGENRYIEGFWEAFRAECAIVQKSLANESFNNYFETKIKNDFKQIDGKETMIIISDTFEQIEEMIISNSEKQIFIVTLNDSTQPTNENINWIYLEKFYNISQIFYLFRPYITNQKIYLYFNNEYILSCSYKQLYNITGVDLFKTISYQLKFLKEYVGMNVINRVQFNRFYSEETWIYDKLIYKKLKGIENYKESDTYIGFYNYKGDVCPDFLNSPHCWVGEHFKNAIRSFSKVSLSKGFVVESCNQNNIDSFNIIVFWDCPPFDDLIFEKALESGKKIILYATESVGINLCNDNSRNFYLFDKIGTWRKNEIDSKKIGTVKPVYFEYDKTIGFIPYDKRKIFILLGSIFWRKSSPFALYKERENIILWMEKKHLGELDFYGKCNRNTKNMYKSYKGRVDDKLNLLARYRFCVCYENNHGYDGYVTEKIYDCIFARCVPIYLGAPDIEEYIPKECYIDARKFNSFAQIYEYILNLTEEQWNMYINAMDKFIKENRFGSYDGTAMFNDFRNLLENL